MSIELITPDGTTVDLAGNYIHLSCEEFLRLVQSENRCLICGNQLNEETKEHVIPDWLIRYCSLENKSITLPNRQKIHYPSYKIACCLSCNGALSRIYEEPISAAFKLGYDGFCDFIKSNRLLVFSWLCLIVFKTHAKDLTYRAEVDRRIDSGRIADMYHWPDLHHIHAVSRAAIFGTKVLEDVIGSIYVVPISNLEDVGEFDYRDNYVSQTVMIRIREIAIIAVLNDSGAIISMIYDRIFPKTPPNACQLAEILSDFQAAALHLQNRPSYGTRIQVENSSFEIFANLPDKREIAPYDPAIKGEFLWLNVTPFGKVMSGDRLIEEQEDEIRGGKITFFGPDDFGPDSEIE